MLREETKVYPVRISDFTPDKKIKFSSVLDFFQEIAGVHSKKLGCGIDDFEKSGYGWVLANVKFEILKPFSMYSSVTVKTWPLKPSFVKFQREYLILDEQGDVLCKGSALWTIIDLKTRKLAAVKDVYRGIGEFKTDKNFDGKFLKIKSPDEGFCFAKEVEVYFSDTDVNGHANNVKYANFVVDALGFEIENSREFQIDYHKELLSGQKVAVYKAENGHETIIKGFSFDQLIFTACYRK